MGVVLLAKATPHRTESRLPREAPIRFVLEIDALAESRNPPFLRVLATAAGLPFTTVASVWEDPILCLVPPKMRKPDDGERDKARFLAGLTATLHSAGRDYPCVALDINREGIMLAGDFPPPEDPDVRITVSSAAGDLVLEATGRVAYVRPEEETHLGLSFEGLDESQRSILESLIARVVEATAPAALARLERGASGKEVQKALETMPVAHRIQLAMRADPKEREFLFQDEDLQVLESLARNPTITMPEVISLARRIKILPSTLDLIAKDHRWAGNEELRILIATHPRVSLPTAMRLVDTLSDIGLRKVIRKSGLHPAVRQRILTRVPAKRLEGW